MHRSRDNQVGIFEPWDWVYIQAFPSLARAESYQKLVQTPIFMVLNPGILVLKFEKFEVQKLTKKKPIWRGSSLGPNPSTSRPLVVNFKPAFWETMYSTLAYIQIFRSLDVKMATK
jgi:hypothetical protein